MSKYAGFPEQAPMRPNRLTKMTSVPTTMSDTQSPMIISPMLIPPKVSCFIRGRTLLLTTSLLAKIKTPGTISARPNIYKVVEKL